jgi:hypothetical protein
MPSLDYEHRKAVTPPRFRIVEWLGKTPIVGMCSNCRALCKISFRPFLGTREALANLQMQFDRHGCERKMDEAA